MKVKEIIKSQYRASLEMLRRAIEACPDPLWGSSDYKNPFWHIAYHALFYTHFYLHPSEEAFVPWEKHNDAYLSLEGNPEGSGGKEVPYSKEDLLAYLRLCLEQVKEHVDAMDLEAESGFYWLPFNKLELQFYSIRHIMQHTGELGERLGGQGEIEVGWVGTVPAA
jgi:hypothetical protein